ncbi:DUF2442 domain-containing protein [Janthinobacterium agaricidamnosum]|uniref:Uncharacterized protein n=1 Tax=Janthinobacterium agaricidamnosum NBRC 102515 = DSM 9628 TaxID=1349767 RepID=W0V0P0_9BURK|nr:DUF2442 domain-containing protein [Janthinobacterium agaricidamnosum]CDG82399.1 putative uncharacterized protein pinR [Janthinobacterium agaricidamnosum NBRC 102515 = DSM 9628]
MNTIKARSHIDEPVTEAILQQAIVRSREQSAPLQATTLHYLPEQKRLLIGFADDNALALSTKNYVELADLSDAELKRMTLGLSGTALCLDERDLHMSITGLVSASKPLMAMALSLAAVRNGSSNSAAKAHASRQNGLKGGRPRKLAPG